MDHMTINPVNLLQTDCTFGNTLLVGNDKKQVVMSRLPEGRKSLIEKCNLRWRAEVSTIFYNRSVSVKKECFTWGMAVFFKY